MPSRHLIRSASAACLLVLGLAGCGEVADEPVADEPAVEETDPVDVDPDPTATTPADGAGETATTSPSPTDTGEGGEPIEIVETSFDLALADAPGDEDPLTVMVPSPGTYTFRVTNDADIVHSLAIEGHGLDATSGDIPPGETTTMEVTFEEAGEYDLYCPIANHQELGMDGSVAVQAG